PPGSYDVLIEIYDSDSGVLVDEFGPNESSAFSLLPLEDAASDGVAPPPVVVVSDEHGGGGSVSWAALLALAAGAALRLLRTSRAPAGPVRVGVRVAGAAGADRSRPEKCAQSSGGVRAKKCPTLSRAISGDRQTS
ncbi:MAG TPA: hypothetical protein VFV10_18370, partial [Gammaproteobacteria bacterium]|nr:hypothetical protein [Gammaproteobacteria bacterium]